MNKIYTENENFFKKFAFFRRSFSISGKYILWDRKNLSKIMFAAYRASKQVQILRRH